VLEPASQSVLEFATANFTAAVDGTGPFTYVWRLNEMNYAGDVRGGTLTIPEHQSLRSGELFGGRARRVWLGDQQQCRI